MSTKVIHQAKLELARRELFYYAHLKAPDFYAPDRAFLVELCDEIQAFTESDDHDVLIINAPPRHGKSRTAQISVEWALGRDKSLKVMTGSYNETLATHFSKGVRNAIQEEKADKDRIVYSDIFPGIKIKFGDGAMNIWSLEGGYNNYLATSPTGTATGFGADLLIVDDLIKSAAEANTAHVLEAHWEWFTNTMLSRLETGGKIIIIMTRWHSKDLAGRALQELPELGFKVKHVSFKALQDDGRMLCDAILPKEEYQKKIKAMGEDIASANYQQEPIDIKGRLYSHFKEYDPTKPPEFQIIKSYTDTADEGKDYLCSIIYGVFDREAYILDVYFTKDPMEITEIETAKRLNELNVNLAVIESNNGGRSFARRVGELLKKFSRNRTVIKWFYQSKNKKARINTNAPWVMEHIYFPSNWRTKWPEYYKSMYEYQREGKNAHDDAQDATTGVAEWALLGVSTSDIQSQVNALKQMGL